MSHTAPPSDAPAAPPDFRGYNPIRFTPCPDEFFDRQLADMDDDELRITLYSFRRTFGFKKTDDAISISQYLHGIVTRDGRRLDAGCGLKTPRQVLAGLAKAERRRTIFSAFFCKRCGCQVDDDAMRPEERTQTLVNGERKTYSVRVVPDLCPHCSRRLRGFEEKRYFLNVLDETGSPTPGTPRGSVVLTEGAAGGSVTPIDPPAPPTPPPTVPAYHGDSPATPHPTVTRDSPQEPILQETGRQENSHRRTSKQPITQPPADRATLDRPPTDRPGSEPAAFPRTDAATRRAALHERWSAVSERLRDEMTGRNFAAWISPLRPLAWAGDELLLGVTDPSVADYLELRLRPSIERAAAAVAERPTGIRVVVLPE